MLKNINGVNESFNLSVHSKNTNFFGIFSHNSEYKNDITLISKNYIFSAERFSAPPTTIKLPVIIKKMNKIKEIKVKKDDTFYNFFERIFSKLKERNILYYHNRILHDIYFIHKLQKKEKINLKKKYYKNLKNLRERIEKYKDISSDNIDQLLKKRKTTI